MDFIIILLNYIMTALILTIECTVLLPEKMQYRYKVLIFAGNILFTIFKISKKKYTHYFYKSCLLGVTKTTIPYHSKTFNM